MNDRIETLSSDASAHAAQIPMSATKSMIGHPQVQSAPDQRVLFAMNEGWIPPTLNLKEPDRSAA
jgi:3-oxoacyl-(acyl-carrier-protein) synthase